MQHNAKTVGNWLIAWTLVCAAVLIILACLAIPASAQAQATEEAAALAATEEVTDEFEQFSTAVPDATVRPALVEGDGEVAEDSPCEVGEDCTLVDNERLEELLASENPTPEPAPEVIVQGGDAEVIEGDGFITVIVPEADTPVRWDSFTTEALINMVGLMAVLAVVFLLATRGLEYADRVTDRIHKSVPQYGIEAGIDASTKLVTTARDSARELVAGTATDLDDQLLAKVEEIAEVVAQRILAGLRGEQPSVGTAMESNLYQPPTSQYGEFSTTHGSDAPDDAAFNG